jgi:hypothetical protein
MPCSSCLQCRSWRTNWHTKLIVKTTNCRWPQISNHCRNLHHTEISRWKHLLMKPYNSETNKVETCKLGLLCKEWPNYRFWCHGMTALMGLFSDQILTCQGMEDHPNYVMRDWKKVVHQKTTFIAIVAW